MQISVPRMPVEQLGGATAVAGEASAPVAARVQAARDRQHARQGRLNAELQGEALRELAIADDAERLLLQSVERLQLSARAYHRMLRVARTIADLGDAEVVAAPHVAEAVRYRELDRPVQ